MKIFIINKLSQFERKLKSLTDDGYYLNSMEDELNQLLYKNIVQFQSQILNSPNLKSLVIYLGTYPDEPMKLEWDYILINQDDINDEIGNGTNFEEIRESYPEAEIQFII